MFNENVHDRIWSFHLKNVLRMDFIYINGFDIFIDIATIEINQIKYG